MRKIIHIKKYNKKMNGNTKIGIEIGTLDRENAEKMLNTLFKLPVFDVQKMKTDLDKIRETLTTKQAEQIETELGKLKTVFCEFIEKMVQGNYKAIEQRGKNAEKVIEKHNFSRQGCAVVLEAEDMMKLFNGKEVVIDFGELREIGSVRISSQK